MAMYEHLSEKLEKDYSITLREREFVEEYEALLQTMGKDHMKTVCHDARLGEDRFYD